MTTIYKLTSGLTPLARAASIHVASGHSKQLPWRLFENKSSLHLTPKRSMFIQVEETKESDSLRFYPGRSVMDEGTASFEDAMTAAKKSPLAKALFKIDGVKKVLFDQSFIEISKSENDWNVLKPQIFSEIMVFYTMQQPILYDDNFQPQEESAIVKEIKEVISEKIRPTIQEDGGDLEFVCYEDGIVQVRLQGACTTCPSSEITLKNGIRNMLQYHFPEIQDVVQVD